MQNKQNNRSLRFWTVAITCGFLIGCMTLSKGNRVADIPPMSSEVLPAQEIMGLYKASTETLFTKAASVPESQVADAKDVLVFKGLFESMTWGQVGSDHITAPLQKRPIGKSVFSIMSFDNTDLKIPGPILTTTHNPKYNSILIRPYPVSEKWAGAFLLHELSRVREMNLGQHFSRGKSEYRASRLAMKALNIATDGAYYEALDTVMNRLGINSADDFVAMLKKREQVLGARVLLDVEQTLGLSTGWPLSPQEKEMRQGLNVIALLLRFYENKGLLARLPGARIHQAIEEVLAGTPTI